MRMSVKLRVQNPNDEAVVYDGVALSLDVRGYDFASGVSDAKGSVPRFGEAVVVVPVSIPATSVLKQAYALASSGNPTLDFVVRGKLASPGGASQRFETRGEFALPAGLARP
jgi:hypothetical protein